MAKPGGEGVVLLPLTIALLSFAWVTVIARLAVRRWKKMLGLDDWLMCIGLVCAFVPPPKRDFLAYKTAVDRSFTR